jgi:hypothetical protein
MRRSFLLATIVLALLAPARGALTPAALAAQADESWTSPTYGFSVSWDPTIWQEEPNEGFTAQGVNQLDRLLLSGPGNFWIEGLRNYGGVAGDCVRGELDTLAGDPSLTSIAQRDDLAADGPGAAADAFEATIAPEGEEPVRIVYYVECRSLSDDSVAIFTVLTVRDLLSDALALARPVIDSLTLGAGPAPEANAAAIDAETFGAWSDLVAEAAPVAGPLSGSLQLEPEAPSAALAAAGVEASDFVARLRWQNPTATERWDVGIAFRDQPDGSHYRLTFDATGAWAFGIGTGEKIASGEAASMNLEPGGANGLVLIVSGGRAGFAVNGEFVSELDVSVITNPGDVTFGSGFVAANAEDGATVNYRDFAVVSLAGLVIEPADAPLVPVDPEPTDVATPVVEPEAPPLIVPDLPSPPDLGAPDAPPTDDGAPRIVAAEVEPVDGSGVSGLATLTEVEGAASLNLVLRGADGEEIAVVHEGTCSDLSTDPVFLLEDPDASGRSKTDLGVPREEVLDADHAIAVHASAEAFGEVVACGEIGG